MRQMNEHRKFPRARLPLIAVVLIGCATSAFGSPPELPAVKDGDLIFHTSKSAQSVAIQKATGSPYSHIGMIFYRDGQPFVYEAVSSVRYTGLGEWIARGEGGRFVVKRLRNARIQLTPSGINKLRKAAQEFHGRPYDLAFDWSDDQLYCSELVWKVYDRALGIRVGTTQRVKDFNLTDPVVRAKLRERYGEKVPLDAPVISPVAIFNSPLLITITQQ